MNNEQKIYNLFSKCIDSENFNKFTVQEWFEILSHELSGNFIIKPYWLNPKYLFRGRFNYDSENNQSILFLTDLLLLKSCGNVIKNLKPPVILLLTVIVPPCASTIPFTIDKPNPEPPVTELLIL